MSGPDVSLLELPSSVAATRLVRVALAEAGEALERLAGGRDPDGLHDFRVAVRRLRSALRAHRSSLGKAAGRKLQRRLRDLASSSGEGRDLEVQVEWLEGRRDLLRRGERSGLNWLLRRLRAARRAAVASAVLQARRDFPVLADELLVRLDGVHSQPHPFREPVAACWDKHSTQLLDRLARIHDADDGNAIHEARIRAKRARYLLEPLRGEADGAKALVSLLKALQAVLGDLHDAHVLEATLSAALDDASSQKARRLRELALAGNRAGGERERRRDERAGLVALIALVRVRRDQLFSDFRERWTDDAVAGFARAAAAFGNSLQPPAPDAIPVECERKYLLRELPPFVRDAEVREIDQGWLPGKTLRERIRRTRDASGERFFRTVKLGAGVNRIEVEEECDRALFDAMWPLTAGCRIRKRRWLVPAEPAHEGGPPRTWEVDEFLDRDLAMAEIELASEHEALRFPDWLAPFVEREVTDDGSFTNLALATAASS